MSEMTQIVLFREQQHFRQWWVWLLVLGVAALQWWGFMQQIVLGQPWGNNPGPDWMMWLFWLLFGIGLPLFFYMLALVVTVTPEHIVISYRPLTKRIIPLADIESVEVRTYQALREYGGYGLRGSPRNAAYNVSGHQGVALILRDGRRVMIGSLRVGELALAIDRARRE
jgi:hypothetical protein